MNMAEMPAVPRDTARLRLQLMASHTREQLRRTAEVLLRRIAEGEPSVAAG